ncbi:MAG TPA: ThiF family adenylyltransferase [Jatrophihabitantaceae bacterium]|jgi:hypothetical protein
MPSPRSTHLRPVPAFRALRLVTPESVPEPETVDERSATEPPCGTDVDVTESGDLGVAVGQAPRFNPAVRVLWRSREAVQLELGARAVVLDGVDPQLVRDLSARVPTRPHEAAGADRAALSEPATTTLLDGGYLWPAAADGAGTQDRARPPVPRLAAELASLTPRHGTQSAAVLRARSKAAVAVHGTGRVAAHVAAVLAAAGVGRLHVVDAGDVTLRDAVPGGLNPADEGRAFAAAAADAIRAVAPEVDLTPLPFGRRPDLVILACDEPIDTERREALHARCCTYLTVRLGVDDGVVGPLVIPGLSSCLRCADLHRRDRDPAWGALAAQLTVPPRYGPASDVAVATVIAGIAARESLAYLDGEEPATIDATLEMALPDWRIRRRSWAAHERCECGAGSQT